MGTLEIIKESTRQLRTRDTKFLQKLIYFFELEVPSSIGAGPFFFPLAINPQSYTMGEPFALEKTYTEGAGLFVEENGIIDRVIRLRGTTGFRPRKLGAKGLALTASKPETASYGRTLPRDLSPEDELSGQRHFQYLQDAVFRTYADLKRDPTTAEGTKLYFHNPKDEEAWLVAPQNFELERNSGKPVTYQYNIELLVLGPKDASTFSFSEDRNILDKIRGAVAAVREGVSLITGGINDLTAFLAELERIVKGASGVFDDLKAVNEACARFASGATSFIAAPYATVGALQDAVEAWTRPGSTVTIPDYAHTAMMRIGDGLDLIGMHPAAFFPKTSEILRAASGGAADSSAPSYTGAQEYELGAGDTLASLAARYLGDARRWRSIAALNGLRPPFTSDQASADLSKLADAAMPGVVGVGRKILIPNFAPPPENQSVPSVLGVDPRADAEEQVLGVDLELVPCGGRPGRPAYDLAADTARGSVDARLVRGRKNFVQGLYTRVETEQGTDLLYRNLGLPRIVSLSMKAVDIELGRVRVLETLKQDPRVSAVRNLDFQPGTDTSPDALEMVADVEVRGFTQATTVRTALTI